MTSRLFRLKADRMPNVAYAAVFNGGKWKITWWGKIKGDSATFHSMPQGAVFLPLFYIKGKLIPAGWPTVVGSERQITCSPDTLHKRSVAIPQQDKYLIYRPGKKYQLFYWDTKWELLDEKIAEEGKTELLFNNLPANALFLLLPEYSVGLERPFMFNNNGERIWL
jgi:hypothetical protein